MLQIKFRWNKFVDIVEESPRRWYAAPLAAGEYDLVVPAAGPLQDE